MARWHDPLREGMWSSARGLVSVVLYLSEGSSVAFYIVPIAAGVLLKDYV